MTEPSPTIISRDGFRLYVIAEMVLRIRKRKGKTGCCISDTYIVRVHENTSLMGFMVENRTEWGLNGRIDKCD